MDLISPKLHLEEMAKYLRGLTAFAEGPGLVSNNHGTPHHHLEPSSTVSNGICWFWPPWTLDMHMEHIGHAGRTITPFKKNKILHLQILGLKCCSVAEPLWAVFETVDPTHRTTKTKVLQSCDLQSIQTNKHTYYIVMLLKIAFINIKLPFIVSKVDCISLIP